MSKLNHSGKQTAASQKFIFKIIAVLLPLFILLIFEGFLRLAGYGDNLDLFIQNPTDGYEKYMMVNPVVGKKYFQKFEYTAPANDIFYADKPENTFRIFIMGSSTVYGFPYERNLMFSRILHKRLEDAYPDKKIELINTAITAINSFTLLDFTNEILAYEPDAILMYAGHNEFYGAFGIGSNETMSRNPRLTRLHITLMSSRIYQLIRNSISAISQKVAAKNKDTVHGTLMKRMVGNSDILLNSEEYNVAMERYKQNMSEILKKVGKKNVPLFLSELVCNINGMKPFNSIATENMEGANDEYTKAQIAENNEEYDKALDLYYKAKDLDCIRFRASEDVNRIVNELIDEYKVYKVPMLSFFQNHSANKLIGNNLMTEHVHPNIQGIFLMADAFFTEMVQSGVLGEPGESPVLGSEYYKRNWGYTALDSLTAHHRVQTLKGFWPFVKTGEKEVNYLIQYQSKSYLDSLAFSAIKNPDVSLADTRLALAKNYEKTGQIARAYKEYEALLRNNPYIAVNYRDAANCLLQLSDLPLALTYFQKSLEYEDSFFASFRISEIYLLMGDYENAILNFKKSFALAPDDKKVNVLAKSYIANVYANKTDEAKAVAEELKRVKAGQYLKIPSKTYVYTQYIPYQTREQVNKAKQLFGENKNDEALELLKSSLQIYNSHIAIRLIGDIYYSQHNLERAYLYYEKVYKQFMFDPLFLHHLVLIYIEKKEIENARNSMKQIERIDPGNENLKILSLLLSKLN